MKRSLILLLAAVTALPVLAQDVTEADYMRAERMLRQHTTPMVYRNAVSPNWMEDGTFWYRVRSAEGAEFVRVFPEARRNKRRPAFDHARLAEALSQVSEADYDAWSLPFFSFEFQDGDRSIAFTAEGSPMVCDLRRYRCEAGEALEEETAATPWWRSTDIVSPDGAREAFVKDHNLWVRDKETGAERQMTFDGEEDYAYATNNAGWTKSDRPVVLWSPDSEKIATFKHDGRGVSMMHLVNTQQGAPELESWRYPFPGDSLIFRIERVVIHVDDARVVRLDMPADDHRSTITDHIVDGGQWADIEWSDDSSRLFFVSSSRDHKRALLREADPETGSVRDIHEEVEDTFYESGYNQINWTTFPEENEFVWYSQQDDWGHLYRHDLGSGALKNRITSGPWKVLAVRNWDHAADRILFTGAGREAGDPYFQYLYSVRFDGSDLKLLTPDSLNHSVTFSPDYRYFIDTASSPTMPQVITLRRTEDGSAVVELERADISQLVASGWKPPIPFQVKARDGETDLFGLMYTPTNMDPTRKYPILNYLYPGPQSGSVGSRSFVPSRSDKQAVSELGFIVVELDAMGSPMRSKSFHEAYYGNMGDNGLPDQKGGIEQLAARHAFMDLDKVGIWGHSGGGFASTAGLLRYPDFYKVAVSGAGNHDNATYEDDWGEKWQGLLERYPDGTTNYDNQANHLLVDNLKGKLLIAHGSMDSNVPPNNTLLLAEALMNAGKDFDMLIFPNSRHGFRQGEYWMRRRWDYFVRHLKGVEPPKEFQFGQQQPRQSM
ncbi:MAG: DPP IV N-terminal domain-containing protein [Rhodothermales bacterium]|nr:DPP IV N-terminal domain-containing protein [Rhodothermales bacterium]MBO6780522.1 DPP IV N-terminal domain-containing protein [Rhodothermales bacterium]